MKEILLATAPVLNILLTKWVSSCESFSALLIGLWYISLLKLVIAVYTAEIITGTLDTVTYKSSSSPNLRV